MSLLLGSKASFALYQRVMTVFLPKLKKLHHVIYLIACTARGNHSEIRPLASLVCMDGLVARVHSIFFSPPDVSARDVGIHYSRICR